MLVAVDPWTAAGSPPICTVATRPPVSIPEKGWGKGVGTNDGPAGTITMCMSVPTT
jgi:hypothetical protein